MTSPVVSVVMSVLNAAPYLDAAVESIGRQSFTKFEFVIINDGSTDGTAGILARHASEDARITVLSQERAGLVAALNRGIAAASGQLIARMDGDDIAAPDRLARQVLAFEQAPDAVAIGTAYTVIDAGSRPGREVHPPTNPDAIRSTLEHTNCIAHPTVMMRRDALMKAGGYRRAFLHCEDYDLWLRLAEIGALRNLAERLLLYRDFPKKHSAKFTEQQTLSELAARASATLRRQGLADPMDTSDHVTREVLDTLGVPRATVDFAIMRRALQAARRAVAVGDGALADDLIDLARSQPRSGLRDHLYYAQMRMKVMSIWRRGGPYRAE